jgi:hypothetical protein
MWSLDEWCPSNNPWTVHGAINNCWLETGGVGAELLAFGIALGCSLSALKLVEELRARGGSLKGPIGMSGEGMPSNTACMCSNCAFQPAASTNVVYASGSTPECFVMFRLQWV